MSFIGMGALQSFLDDDDDYPTFSHTDEWTPICNNNNNNNNNNTKFK